MMSVCGADISKFFWLIIFVLLTGFFSVVPEDFYVCSVSRGEGRRVSAYVCVTLTPTRGWGESQRQTHIHTERGWGRGGESGKEDLLKGILFYFLGEEKSYLRNSLMSVGNNGILGTLSCKRGCKYKFLAFSVSAVLWGTQGG